MTGDVTVVVNFEALDALVKRLTYIQNTFDAMGGHPGVSPDALGDGALTAEFERFLDGWSQGRRRISGELAAVVKVVSHALATYGTADRGIAAHEQASLAAPGGNSQSGAAGTAQ